MDGEFDRNRYNGDWTPMSWIRKNKKRLGFVESCVIFCLFFIIMQTLGLPDLFAQGTPDATGTPDVYNVTMQSFEASQDNGTTWVTVANTPTTVNIASVSAGQKVGDWVSGAELPIGTYNRVRHNVSSTFVIRGYVYHSSSNTTFFTTASGVGNVSGNVTNTSLMSGYGAQSIAVPDGGDCSGGRCSTEEADSFTITLDSSLSKRIRFDVTNRLALYEQPGPTYELMPQEPVVDNVNL